MFQGVWKMILNFLIVLRDLWFIPQQSVWILKVWVHFLIPKTKLEYLCMAWEEKFRTFRRTETSILHTKGKRFWHNSSWTPSCIHRFQESFSILTRANAAQVHKQWSNLQLVCVYYEGKYCTSVKYKFSKNCTYWPPLPIPSLHHLSLPGFQFFFSRPFPFKWIMPINFMSILRGFLICIFSPS